MTLVAGPTRLELATSGVTGRRSSQLNYGPALSVPRAQQNPKTVFCALTRAHPLRVGPPVSRTFLAFGPRRYVSSPVGNRAPKVANWKPKPSSWDVRLPIHHRGG